MKIKKSIYQGYLWYSNESAPEVLDNKEKELEIADNANPFIIEGQLFDGETSISIKYVDGHHIYNEYKISELTGVKVEQVFHSNRMGDKQLQFIQVWREEKDLACNTLPVLQPQEFVFMGFKNKEE